MNPKISGVNFGGRVVEFDKDLFVVKRCKAMHRAYCRQRAVNDDVCKFPMNPNESFTDWQKRTLPDRNNALYNRRSGEDIIDAGTRLFEEQNPQIAIDNYVPLMNEFLSILGLAIRRVEVQKTAVEEGEVTQEVVSYDGGITVDGFENTKWGDAKRLIADFCREAGIPAVEYFS